MLLTDFLQVFGECMNGSIAFALVACRHYENKILTLGPSLKKLLDETCANAQS